MAKTSAVAYDGALRTTAVHLRSGNTIITDAPIDNNGKGEAFSPTDLVATALASCMITIMGIRADKMDLDITGTKAEIQKIMGAQPRRIAEIIVKVTMADGTYSLKDREVLEKAARTCPVALTLNDETIQRINFIWP